MRRERITITIRDDVLKKVDTIIDGKKIRNRSNAIETVLLEKFKNRIIQKAVVLGAFRGVKINGKELSEILMRVNGKTLIEHNIEKLKTVGVKEVIIATGAYKKEIKEILGDGSALGVKIDYFESKGTAGIFKNTANILKNTFLMFNGDIYIKNFDIDDMYNFHKMSKATSTVAVTTTNDSSYLGSIFMKGGLITNFKEKEKEESLRSHLVNAGVYIMEPEVCKMKLSKKTMIEQDIFPELARQKKLSGYQIENDWIHLHDEKHLKFYLDKGLI